MYDVPQGADFDRNLSMICHEAHGLVRVERGRLTADFAARGLASSGGLIGAVADFANQTHKDAIAKAMHLVNDFAERMKVSAATLATRARPVLENLGQTLLGEVPPAGLSHVQQQIRGRYHIIFQQRIDGALRDVAIGFIGGRSMPMPETETMQAKAARLLKAYYDHAQREAAPRSATEFSQEIGLSEDDAKRAWRYLADKRLIRTYGDVLFAGAINAHGIDVIEGMLQHPRDVSPTFPGITYINIMNVETMTGSQVQQGATGSTQRMEVGAEVFRQVGDLLGDIAARIEALATEEDIRRELQVGIDTIKPQLGRKNPSAAIVREGLKSIRTILEGVVASAVAPALIQRASELIALLS